MSLSKTSNNVSIRGMGKRLDLLSGAIVLLIGCTLTPLFLSAEPAKPVDALSRPKTWNLQWGPSMEWIVDHRWITASVEQSDGSNRALRTVPGSFLRNTVGGYAILFFHRYWGVHLDFHVGYYQVRFVYQSEIERSKTVIKPAFVGWDTLGLFGYPVKQFRFILGAGPAFHLQAGAYRVVNSAAEGLLGISMAMGKSHRFHVHTFAKLGVFFNAGFGEEYENSQTKTIQTIHNAQEVTYDSKGMFYSWGIRIGYAL